eukprot:scaffold6247_cov256-Pinguiococcus_pyrenoidosus.AAC.5
MAKAPKRQLNRILGHLITEAFAAQYAELARPSDPSRKDLLKTLRAFSKASPGENRQTGTSFPSSELARSSPAPDALTSALACWQRLLFLPRTPPPPLSTPELLISLRHGHRLGLRSEREHHELPGAEEDRAAGLHLRQRRRRTSCRGGQCGHAGGRHAGHADGAAVHPPGRGLGRRARPGELAAGLHVRRVRSSTRAHGRHADRGLGEASRGTGKELNARLQAPA